MYRGALAGSPLAEARSRSRARRLEPGGRCRARYAVSVEDGDARVARRRHALLQLLAECDRGRLLRGLDVGMRERLDCPLDVLGAGRQLGKPFESLDLVLEDVSPG